MNLIELLKADYKDVPWEMLHRLLEKPEEIVPPLLEYLGKSLEDPEIEDWPVEDESILWSMMLLAQLRVPQAHPLLLRFVRFPEDLVDQWFGDVITETFPGMLLATCDQNLEGIKALMLDQEAGEYVRIGASEALKDAVALGWISKEEAGAALFEAYRSFDEADLSALVLSNLLDLEVTQYYPEIQADLDKDEYLRNEIGNIEEWVTRFGASEDEPIWRAQRWPSTLEGWLHWCVPQSDEQRAQAERYRKLLAQSKEQEQQKKMMNKQKQQKKRKQQKKARKKQRKK